MLRRSWESGALYIAVACVLSLIYLLSSGIGIYDWQKEVPYFDYIRASLRQFHALPLMWWNLPDVIREYPAGHTSNFIGNPETMLFSPLTVLLPFMPVARYVKLLAVLHFAAGVVGMLLVRRRLGWSDAQFRLWAILFLFSPLFIQRFAIGYSPWVTLYLFPWLLYFLASPRRLPRVLGLAGLLALILLEGGIHVAIWFALLYGLYALARAILERDALPAVEVTFVAVGAVLLSLVRTYTTVASYTDSSYHWPFRVGLNPLSFLIGALAPPVLVGPLHAFFLQDVWFGLESWDGAVFWGAALFLFVLLFVKYRAYRRLGAGQAPGLNVDALLLAATALFVLAFFRIFQGLTDLLGSVGSLLITGNEKRPYRFAIVAYFGFSFVAACFAPELWASVRGWALARRRQSAPAQLAGARGPLLFEAVLALPLLFATVMWLRLAVATPFRDIADPSRLFSAPAVQASAGIVPPLTVSPRALTVAAGSAAGADVVFPKIDALDGKYLYVATGNGQLTAVNGALAIHRTGAGPITVAFRPSGYRPALYLTVAAWLGLVVAGFALRFRRAAGRATAADRHAPARSRVSPLPRPEVSEVG